MLRGRWIRHWRGREHRAADRRSRLRLLEPSGPVLLRRAPAGAGAYGARVRRATGFAVVSTAAAVLCLAAALATGSTAAHAARARAQARASHVLNVKDEGHLHLVHESGSELVEEGSATGTVPGTVRVSFNVGATVSGQFTIYARGGGSITGHGSGSLRSTGAYSTFGGSLEVTGGSGRFRHAHGSGNIYGAINRRTYAMTVQTVGKLNY
jgi:hypothetical protein